MNKNMIEKHKTNLFGTLSAINLNNEIRTINSNKKQSQEYMNCIVSIQNIPISQKNLGVNFYSKKVFFYKGPVKVEKKKTNKTNKLYVDSMCVTILTDIIRKINSNKKQSQEYIKTNHSVINNFVSKYFLVIQEKITKEESCCVDRK